MVLPPFVGAIGMMAVFGQMGAVNALLHPAGLLPRGEAIDWLGRGRFAGIVLLNGLHLYPILYLNAAAALANIDPALEEAAENLGCTGWRKFRRVTLPLMMPGIFAGGSIVFIWAFTELGTPLMFNFTRILPVQIFIGMKELAGNGMPFALVVVMLAAAMGLYWVTRFCLGRAPVPVAGRATMGRARKRGARDEGVAMRRVVWRGGGDGAAAARGGGGALLREGLVWDDPALRLDARPLPRGAGAFADHSVDWQQRAVLRPGDGPGRRAGHRHRLGPDAAARAR